MKKEKKEKKKRFLLIMEKELHYNFKNYAVFKEISMTKILNTYVKELMEKEKDFIIALEKER